MTTEFLYGIKPEVLEPMKYFEALEHKLMAGKYLYQGLYLGLVPDENHRMFYVEKAMRHTEKLLAEKH